MTTTPNPITVEDIDLTPIDVHCDTCGAVPGNTCQTPAGSPARPHQDRRANADVINRHLRYTARQANR